MRIGETYSLMGEPRAACKSYKHVLHHFKSNSSTQIHDQLLHAEAHLLLSQEMFHLGELEFVFNEEGDVLKEEGAKWHAEQAQAILDLVQNADGHHRDVLKLLKKSTRIQWSKLLIHLDDHQTALKHFLGTDEEETSSGNDERLGLSSPASNAEVFSHRASSNTTPSEVTAEELDFKQLHALALFKAGQKMQATEEFEAILKQIEKDQSGTEVSSLYITS